LILAGSLVQALSNAPVLVPGEMVSGGVARGADHQLFYPLAHRLMVFLGNVPLFLVGWRYLGGGVFSCVRRGRGHLFRC